MEWIINNWWIIVIVAGLMVKILNLVTMHWSSASGLGRVILFLIDLLDLVKTTPAPGSAGKNTARGPTMILMIFCLSLANCSTVDGGKRFDPAKAMAAACAITPAASQLQYGICQTLEGKTREDCLKAQKIVENSSRILLGVAGAVYGACSSR